MAELLDKGMGEVAAEALLQTARRIATAKPAGGWACHIHLSQLPAPRLKENLSFAVNMLRAAVERFLGRIFILENSDIVVICWQARLWQLRSAIASLRPLFETEGRGSVYHVNGEPNFATWYDLDQQSGEFLLVAERLAARQQSQLEQARLAPSPPAELPSPPERSRLDPVKLAGLVARIKDANLAGAIRRQPVCRIMGTGDPRTVFEEVYVSIGELQRLFAPRLDLGLDRWLFRSLTEVLDGRVLAWLAAAEALSLIGEFAINLNLSTILSGEFARFEAKVGNQLRGRMVVEIDKSDLLSDLSQFATVRESLRRRGYRICIDALTGPDLAAIDYGRFAADYYKVVWHPELMPQESEGRLGVERLAALVSVDRIIFGHCGSAEAIAFGQALGLTLFQGWHVDSLMRDLRPPALRLVAGT